MELPRDYRIQGQWIPVTPSKSIPIKKSNNLLELLESNGGVSKNLAQMGALDFNGDELAKIPFRQLLEMSDPTSVRNMDSASFVQSRSCGGRSSVRRQEMNAESSNRNQFLLNGRILLPQNQVEDVHIQFEQSNLLENGNTRFVPNRVIDFNTRFAPSNRVVDVNTRVVDVNTRVVDVNTRVVAPNRVDDVNAQFVLSNPVEDLNTRFVSTSRVEDINSCIEQLNRVGTASSQFQALNQVGDVNAPFVHLYHEDANRRFISSSHDDFNQRFVQSNQEYVNGRIQPNLAPKPQYNTPVPFLPNLNLLPETNLASTVTSEAMAFPTTPSTMEKNQRSMIQDFLRRESIDLESYTANNQLKQCFSNQVESSPIIITSQQNENEGNVVVNQSEEQGENQGIDLNNTSQPKPKRKKHRPKVIREGKSARTPKTTLKPTNATPARTPKMMTPKPANATETTTGKRKYTRKKKESNVQETPSNELGEKVDQNTKRSNQSARRSLNFDLEESQGQEAMARQHEVEPQSREAEKNVARFDLNNSANQLAAENVRVPQTPLQPSQPSRQEAMKTKWNNDFARMMSSMASSSNQPMRTQGENLNKLAKMINGQSITGQSQFQDVLLQGTKRDYNHVCNSQVQANQNLMQLNNGAISVNGNNDDIHKKRRMYNAFTHNCPPTGWKFIPSMQNGSNKESIFADIQMMMAHQNMHSAKHLPMFNQIANMHQVQTAPNTMNNGNHVQAPNTINCHKVSAPNTMNNGNHVQAPNTINCNKVSTLNNINNSSHVQAPNAINCNKVSAIQTIHNGNHAQVSNAIKCHKVSSLDTMNCKQPMTPEKVVPMYSNGHKRDEAYGPMARVETLIANQMKSKIKMQKKNEIPLFNSKPTNSNQKENVAHITQSAAAQNFCSSNYKPSGVLIQYRDPVDDLIRRLGHLNIDCKSDGVMTHLENTLIPYNGGGGDMVPFVGDLLKKRKPRPKVDLDPESNRVWKLLMGIEDGEEGTDVSKEKWWEEERQVFRGRADSFIARMHLIQGDRRFSKWKGSVVDSVIGVFLTQNVSDHLSSSAFMCLAARFPPKSKGVNKNMDLRTTETPIVVIDPEICDLSSPVINESMQMGIKELENSNESQESNLDFHEIELGLGQKSPDSVLGTSITVASCTSAADSEDVASSQNSIDSSQNSSECPNQAINQCNLIPLSNFEAAELQTGSRGNGFNSFTELLQMANDRLLQDPKVSISNGVDWSIFNYGDFLKSRFTGIDDVNSVVNRNTDARKENETLGMQYGSTTGSSTNVKDQNEQLISKISPHVQSFCQSEVSSKKNVSTTCVSQQKKNSMKKSDAQVESSQKAPELNLINETLNNVKMSNKEKVEANKKKSFDWDSLRRNYQNREKAERCFDAMDSLDYEAVRQADVNDISNTIRERGMNNMLAERIKAFLNRLVEDHGSIDLEWLRDVPPDKAKDYLLSIRGLGLKSVECVRLLTLHHLAFPVDTNVGRIAVRLGWVPLQPLPESLQLHLLEMYPILETIQKYLWPRLCKLDQPTLYELHYQLITFGKVFCTKSKPNCNSCPMRGECKHFASAFASARLSLPGPEEKRMVSSTLAADSMHNPIPNYIPLPQLEPSMGPQNQNVSRNSEPIIEEPASPEPECIETSEIDIEDAFYNDPDEIPTIKLNFEEFTQNLQNYMQENNMEIQNGDMSKALVALDPEAACIPMPKLKNVSRLRTEHLVYELPDSHPLLEGFDKREPDDPSHYLLAIWTPGETAQSTEVPKACCNSQESGRMCDNNTCFSCNSIREVEAQTVRGTILVPCRTANRGSFPLNGTYFQVNEVFADHDSSRNPIDVPRSWIWSLPRRTVYFGTSVTSIFKGLTTEGIQHCFWRGFVCVRGFDRTMRSPKPLFARLHFTASRVMKNKRPGSKDE